MYSVKTEKGAVFFPALSESSFVTQVGAAFSLFLYHEKEKRRMLIFQHQSRDLLRGEKFGADAGGGFLELCCVILLLAVGT